MPTRALCCSLLALTASGQAPSPWSTLHVPSGVVASQAASQGKLVTYRDGGTLHAWSAVTRQWTSTAIAGSASLRLNNDCLLAQDATTWTAYSAYRGRFEPLPVGANASLLNATGAVNDSLLLVADGGQLHAFSAFTGAWTSRPLATNHLCAVQRHVAVLAQGTLLSGLDAATGQWTDHAVSATPTTVSADGTAGFAFGAGTVHAYSATRGQWRDTGEPPGAAFTRADDWGLWYGGNRLLAYGAIRGGFALTDGTVNSIAAAQDLFVMVDRSNGVVAFSALTGTWSLPLAAAGATVTSSTAVALLADTTGTHGYSAMHNRAELRTNVGANAGAANVVAWASDSTGGPPWFFSAITGQWYRGPASLLPGDPTLTTTGAAGSTAQGGLAFSPRTGRFVPLADPTVVFVGNGNSAPLLAVGATMLHAFEARTDRWISTPRTGTGTVSPQIWRTGATVFDGTHAVAFGSMAGSWTSQVLPGPVAAFRANSESMRINTPQHVLAWSAIGEAAWFAQFPEFRRVQPTGTTLRLVLAVPAGGVGLLGLGRPAAGPVPLPGLGDLLLVPTSVAILPVPAPPLGEPAIVSLPVPIAPLSPSTEFAAQAANFPAAGTPYLTDVATVMPL